MKIVFLTEMGFKGKVPSDFPNMRTEFAWMNALEADHHPLVEYEQVKDYDHVFIIFPKGRVFLSAEGTRMSNEPNPVSELLKTSFLHTLKANNKKVYYVQEGPHWWYNDYELVDQINFYNFVAQCDAIFAHNESDKLYYEGMFNKPVHVIKTLLIEDLIKDIKPDKQDKVIIGGNFARWYGGFESYNVAETFKLPVWGQTSHATRDGEGQLVHQLPRVSWIDWMKQLSTFKYAVHLMPTVAAGTFALNCAYLGIPCIGNRQVDTQRICHEALSVDVHDIKKAVKLAKRLKEDVEFYQECSKYAKGFYKYNYSLDTWKKEMFRILNAPE